MSQYELNLRDYVRIFRRRKTLIVLVFITILGVNLFFSQESAPSYKAITSVKIEERKTVAGLLTEWIVYSPGDMMESESKLIRGYPVMKKTAYELGMINENSTVDEINRAINTIEEKISTERVGTTNIIQIIATSSSPDEAILLANAVANVYIKENLLNKTLQARSARQFIEEQLTSLEIRLKEKEETLKILSEQSENVTLAEPIRKKLTELQFELNSLLQKYTQVHPMVIQTKEQIKELQQQMKGLSGEDLDYARLSREVEADKKLYSLLKEKLEEARITEAQKVGDISIVNPAVTASVISGPNKSFGIIVSGILGLVLGFAVALVLESLDTSIATIEDVEGIMKVPVLGVLPSVMSDAESKMKSNFFLNIKRSFSHKAKTPLEERYVRLILQYNPTSPIAEAYRNIHTNLKLDPTKKTFLITSAGPREGKSTVLSNLGLSIAQTGLKTLLISSDIRRPILGKTFGVKKDPGLTEVLLGMVALDEAVNNVTDYMLGEMGFEDVNQTPGLDNLWLLTSGQIPFNPAKILESKELVDLIVELKKRFDLIIFDSPPVLPVTDASLLASRIDNVIIVYEIGRTSRDALLRAKNQLDSVGANVCGVILNQTRNKADSDILYPYYYKYRYYRQESADKSKKTKG
ncbi:MAG: polysaccharide biosynthesis tyrosine autokinase [Candidatus Omnitrophota bacterium]